MLSLERSDLTCDDNLIYVSFVQILLTFDKVRLSFLKFTESYDPDLEVLAMAEALDILCNLTKQENFSLPILCKSHCNLHEQLVGQFQVRDNLFYPANIINK